MSSAIGSVILASAQSVGKVFVIGGVGYLAVLFPRKAPFLPRQLVGNVARFTFHTLTIPLIYSTIAVAVTIESVGNYWFVIVGAFCVMATSYIIATILRHIGFLRNSNSQDMDALRVSATFPNIVALPILIFPSLCEFAVVHEGYVDVAGENQDEVDSAYLERQCVAQSTTMIFCYFFSWSLAFWSFGNRQLMQAANQRHEETMKSAEAMDEETPGNTSANTVIGATEDENFTEQREDREGCIQQSSPESEDNDENHPSRPSVPIQESNSGNEKAKGTTGDKVPTTESAHQTVESTDSTSVPPTCMGTMWKAVKQTTTSPGFITMVVAFVTACIPPLQRALFDGGGPLRFFGSAMETLGTASSPISTMVVAASLVPSRRHEDEDDEQDQDQESDNMDQHENDEGDGHVVDENPGITDPNYGPHPRGRRISRFKIIWRSLRRSSIRMLKAIPQSRPAMLRLHVWFCLSRLVLTPAAIVGFIMALDCSSDALNGVPNLAKLVIIVNSALPGALIVIVLLKSSDGMAETASAVAKVYLPSYILSIFTIAAWTAVGLWVTLPDENGHTVCQR